MQNRKPLFYILLSLLVVYNFIFWNEKLGLNLTLFLALSAIGVLFLNRGNLNKKTTTLSFFSLVLSLVFVITSNSAFSILLSISSFLIFTGYVHQQKVKAVFNAFFTSVSSFLLFPYNVFEEIRLAKKSSKPFAAIYKIGKIAILPLGVFIIFYAIYANANPLFNSYSVSFWDKINEYVYRIFEIYPIERFFFIFLGLFLITSFLFNRNISLFSLLDKMFLNVLSRNKKSKVYGRVDIKTGEPKSFRFYPIGFKMNSIITERNISIVLLTLVNCLLMVVNALDISFTWFSFDPKEVDNLAYYVHHGTFMLIFSITLSMLILLYIFRGNQNFYRWNFLLKSLAYFWLLQNAVLSVSVAIRNFRYIEYYYALSHKRIGVIIFLMLVFVGLITMFMKINRKNTTYYLIKENALAAFIMLIVMSSFSWDPYIAEFNLSNPNKEKIDIGY